MEIGHEAIHHHKPVARPDEEVRGAFAGLHQALRGSPALQGTHHAGAHRDHPAPAAPASFDCRRGGGVHLQPLPMHLVLVERLGGDGAEGVQAQVEVDLGQIHAGPSETLHHARGEVKPGGGCCRGAGAVGEDRLVPLRVGKRPSYVRRQRHLTRLSQQGLYITPVPGSQGQHGHPGDRLLGHLAFDGSEIESCPFAETSRRPYQRLPPPLVEIPQQQSLHRTTRRGLAASQPGRSDSSPVDDYQVPGPQQLRKVPDPMISKVSGVQQSRGVSRFCRSLGDGRLGQHITELFGAHHQKARQQAQSSSVGGPGGVTPRWANAAGVATRPRAVRCNIPIWSR